MRFLLGLVAGAIAMNWYQAREAGTSVAATNSLVNATQNSDGSYTLTFPDNSTVNVDAAAVSWLHALAPASVLQAAAATPAAATPATAPLGDLRMFPRRRGRTITAG